MSFSYLSMRNLLNVIFVLVLTFHVAYAQKHVQRLAFTSCIWNYDPTIWDSIGHSVTDIFDPDVFIFLGDTVYNDIKGNGVYLSLDYAYQRAPILNYEKWFDRQNLMTSLHAKYLSVQNTDFFITLSTQLWRKSDTMSLPTNPTGVPGVLAVWDDHDYGYNDAGSWHPKKVKSKQIFQSIFGTAPNSQIGPSEPGIYGSYFCGPNNALQIILLDCRSFKTPHFVMRKSPSSNVTILGDVQWDWLTHQLSQPASIRLIVSSFPVLPEDIYVWKKQKWVPKNKERWSVFDDERQKLLDLLSQSTGRIVIMSGDWHFADLSRIVHNDKEIHEISAGGWHTDDPNFKGYKGLRKRFKHDYSLASVKKDHPPTAWQNFGGLRIDWDKRTVHVGCYDRSGTLKAGYEAMLTFN